MIAVGIVGVQGCGKTTAAREIASLASHRGLLTAGVIAPVVYEGATRVGYDLVDVRTGARAAWLRMGETPPTIGPFGTVASGVSFARHALEAMLHTPIDLAIIDEVGEWELAGGGHSWVLDRLATSSVARVVLVLRESVVGRVAARWALALRTWHPSELPALEVALGIPTPGCADVQTVNAQHRGP